MTPDTQAPGKAGETGQRRFVVSDRMTAHAYGNNGVAVLATPHLANELELTCVDIIAGELAAGASTVGTELAFRHLAATPVGAEVTCEGKLLERHGRRLVFAVSARDGLDLIAEGTHERFIIDTDRFLGKVADKARRLGLAGPSP